MNKYCFFSLLFLLSSFSNFIYPMDMPAYLMDELDYIPFDLTNVHYTKEPESEFMVEKPTRPNTLVECAMQSIVTTLENDLQVVNKSNKESLITGTVEKIAFLPEDLKDMLKELFLERCSKKTFFNFLACIKNSQEQQISGDHIEFLGIIQHVTKFQEGCIEIVTDIQSLQRAENWHNLSWNSLVDRYCTVLMAQKNGRDYPKEFRDENPLFHEED